MTDKPPCRIYALLARQAPVGVLFRRGPSKLVQVIRWDTAQDTFTLGSWFEGRIYERRCDLSPDGELMVTFAANFKPAPGNLGRSAWTAVSKPPYLTPLLSWGKGDCWNGGGLFFSNRDLKLNERPTLLEDTASVPGSPLTIDHLPPSPTGDGNAIELTRLRRDGWTVRQELESSADDPPPVPLHWMEGREPGPEEFLEWYETTREFSRGYRTQRPRILTKERHGVRLVRTDSLARFVSTTHYKVVGDADHLLLEIGKGGWADFDQSNCVVFAKGGKLYRATGSPLAAEELADFNDNAFDHVPTPDSARGW